jgi:hypothetical protein
MAIEYLHCPPGIAYDFAASLALNANRIDEGVAVGIYLREEMEQAIKAFVTQREATPDEVNEIRTWVDSLPWDASDAVALGFGWQGGAENDTLAG